MCEDWRDIPGYEGEYQVSNKGLVKSLKTNRLLKLSISNSGYARCALSKKGVVKVYLVHRIVAQVFIPNPNNLPQVNHRDENKLNNSVNNLEWCTASYNYWYGSNPNRCKASLVKAWNSGKLQGRKAWNAGLHLKDTGKIDNFLLAGKANIEKLKKPILMMDRNTGYVLQRFDSATSAARFMGKSYATSIINCANNKVKSAYGYKWQYVKGGN